MTVGLIAHDSKKEALRHFIEAHRKHLVGWRLLAPEDTAKMLDGTDLPVAEVAPDCLGGDLQVAAAIVEGRVDAMIFLHDPLVAFPGEPCVATFLKICDIASVPLATNLVSAQILLHHLVARSARWHAARNRGGEKIVVERILRLVEPASETSRAHERRQHDLWAIPPR